MSTLKIRDIVWYVDGADDRPYTITNFFFDEISKKRGACLGKSAYAPLRMAWLTELTKEPRQ